MPQSPTYCTRITLSLYQRHGSNADCSRPSFLKILVMCLHQSNGATLCLYKLFFNLRQCSGPLVHFCPLGTFIHRGLLLGRLLCTKALEKSMVNLTQFRIMHMMRNNLAADHAATGLKVSPSHSCRSPRSTNHALNFLISLSAVRLMQNTHWCQWFH